MGNMGYPIVTRLGLNQFWYRHWYSNSNKNYFFNSKQDVIFTKLFKMYLSYGLTFSSSIFFHELFYNNKLKNLRTSTEVNNLKYFRRFYFSNDSLGIEHSYFLRYKTGEYFPLRLWIIKYSNWVIICFNCFKPVKGKQGSKSLTKREHYSLSPDLRLDKKAFKFNRFKLIFIFFKKNFFNKQLTYSF